MNYTIIFTHNPQDFFEGIEPSELVEIRNVCGEDLRPQLEPMIKDGYKAIVLPDYNRGD